jgi:phage recombination protein Bet
MSTENLPAITDEWCLKEFGWTKSQFEVVHRTYFNGMTMDDIKIFGHVCKHTGLDPFLKQIYPVMRQKKLTIQTAIDGYRAIAERTKRYSPGREPSFVYDKEGKPVSATAYVKKMTEDGTWHEVAATAHFKEYNPGVGPFWSKMPHAMIAKCAEALALRKAFPEQLSGIYTKEEMDQADKEEKLQQAECEISDSILTLKQENKHDSQKNDTKTDQVQSDTKTDHFADVGKPMQEPIITVGELYILIEQFEKTTQDFQENCEKYMRNEWKIEGFGYLPAKHYQKVMNWIAKNMEMQAMAVNNA